MATPAVERPQKPLPGTGDDVDDGTVPMMLDGERPRTTTTRQTTLTARGGKRLDLRSASSGSYSLSSTAAGRREARLGGAGSGGRGGERGEDEADEEEEEEEQDEEDLDLELLGTTTTATITDTTTNTNTTTATNTSFSTSSSSIAAALSNPSISNRSRPAHRLIQGGRIAKNRHQVQRSSSTTAAAAALLSVDSSSNSGSRSGQGAATGDALAAADATAAGSLSGAQGPYSDRRRLHQRSSSSSIPNSISSPKISTSSLSQPRSAAKSASNSSISGTNSTTSGPRRPASASSSRQHSSSSVASSSTTASASSATTAASSISSSSRATPASSLDERLFSPPSTTTAISTSTMMPLDDKPVLSFWGPDPVPLPSRFARIKRNLIAGHEAELERCWARLIHALRTEVEHIEDLGAHLIPSIEFADVSDAAQAARFGRDLHRYGVGVVRRVVPKTDADSMMRETVQYLDTLSGGNGNSKNGTNGANGTNGHKSGRQNGSSPAASANGGTALPGPREAYNLKPLLQDPTCYDFFWTPAQVRSRAHPNVLRAQRFMMGLWETTPDDRLAIRLPITYVDRIRIHGTRTGGSGSAGGGSDSSRSSTYGNNQGSLSALVPEQPPQSADDWITALQSSAGIIAQVDNGSLERWEPDGYQRGGTYDHVFHGQWEEYDPWESASRVPATMDLYNGYGACTIFRMFQGVLALSTIEPGMIRLLPSPKLATAYYLLRPFFSPRTAAPEVRAGPEWESYLDPSNWKLERDPDTIIHGAVPGHAQRITEHWHPHLYLRSSMITLPTLQPGDYIFWHPDLPYHISSNNPGLKTPSTSDNDVSMLVYIPAAPLTQTNALYLARQRKAFQRGHPGPDFDSGSGRGTAIEAEDVRPGEKFIAEAGGAAGLQAMGLAPWDVADTTRSTASPKLQVNGHHLNGTSRSSTPNGVNGTNGTSGQKRKHDEDTEMGGTDADSSLHHRSNGNGTRSPSGSSSSNAEAEVVRLSNIILFPDRSMMGYSV